MKNRIHFHKFEAIKAKINKSNKIITVINLKFKMKNL